MDDKIIEPYAAGLSLRDIRAHLSNGIQTRRLIGVQKALAKGRPTYESGPLFHADTNIIIKYLTNITLAHRTIAWATGLVVDDFWLTVVTKECR